MNKIALYTYLIDEGCLTQAQHAMLDRQIVDMESRNEKEQAFAISTKNARTSRVAVSPKQGEVYYDQNAGCYRVWYYTPDRGKAVSAIGNYILDRISPEIRRCQSFINRLQEEQDKARKLLESVPQV